VCAKADTNTDPDTDILARIFAETSDTRDFRKLFLWQAERLADILATILARMWARMSESVSVSASWNASLILLLGSLSYSTCIYCENWRQKNDDQSTCISRRK